MVRQAIRYEIEDAEMTPTQDVFGVEAIHAAAFANNTVGLPKVCPENNIDVINKKTLMHYLCNHHTPERMVVAGVGVEHDQLVEYAQVMLKKEVVPLEPIKTFIFSDIFSEIFRGFQANLGRRKTDRSRWVDSSIHW